MSCFDKEEYKNLKSLVKNIPGIKPNIFQVKLPYKDERYNGFTVAYAKLAKEVSEAKMIAVSVSYCSADDEFKKKHGKYHVLRKWIAGEFVQLPLAHLIDDEDNEALEDFLTSIFSV